MTGARNTSRRLEPGVLALLLLVCALTTSRKPADADSTRVAPAHLPSVKDSPGYVPLHDPDSLAETLGRRPNAPKVKMEFHGGARSMEALGEAVCHALHTNQPDSMLALCVRSDEFRVILWPEFPQSRPATGLRWDDAWLILWGRLNGGSVSSVREYEDHYYRFLSIQEGEVVKYNNFKLHNRITIQAKSYEGVIQSFTFIRSIAERKGRFQIYSMSD